MNQQDDLYRQLVLDGQIFNLGENVSIDWLQYDFDITHLVNVLPNPYVKLAVGAGLYTHYSNFTVASNDDPSNTFESKKVDVVPYATFSLQKTLYNRLSTKFYGSWFSDSVTEYYKARLTFDYQLDESWSVSTAYQLFFRQIEVFERASVGDTYNESKYTIVNLGVSYNFKCLTLSEYDDSILDVIKMEMCKND